jgi:hypothetical protein
MSIGNWLHNTAAQRAIGLAVAILLAAVVGVGLWLTMPPKPALQSLEAFDAYFAGLDPECASILAKRELSGATPYKIDDCEDKAVAQRKGYRDLDQAMRSANATQYALWYSDLQTRASVVGAAFLFLTLFATAWAAWAAADAARIAEKSTAAAIKAADAAEAALQVNRAWLFHARCHTGPFNGSIGDLPVRDGLAFRFEWMNVGQTPALDVNAHLSYRILPKGSPAPVFDVPPIPTAEIAKTGTVGHGIRFFSPNLCLNDQETADFRSGKFVVFVYLLMRYRDIYRPDRRLTEVCMLAEHQGGMASDPEGRMGEAIPIMPVGAQNTAT